MLFNSLAFLCAFLPITYLVFWRLRSKTDRFIWLTLTGYVFYGFRARSTVIGAIRQRRRRCTSFQRPRPRPAR